jgi:hypothetical protein
MEAALSAIRVKEQFFFPERTGVSPASDADVNDVNEPAAL